MDRDADVGSSVIAEDNSVNEKCYQEALGCFSVVAEDGGGVVVADWCVCWSLSEGGADEEDGGVVLHGQNKKRYFFEVDLRISKSVVDAMLKSRESRTLYNSSG